MNPLREKLKRGECLFGTQSFFGSKEIASLLGGMQYDFVFLCAEHPAWGAERVEDLVRYCRSAGTPALVRLPAFDGTFTKKVLDSGADAVLFPMIRSAQEARAAMDACLYPPRGTRGFGPMAAVNWGVRKEADYVARYEEETVRMIQIERLSCVRELEEIARIDGIDCFIFGPNDLAADLGHILDFNHPDVRREIVRAAEILKRAKKPFGVSYAAADPALIAEWKALGATVFSIGADFISVREGAQKVYEKLIDTIKS